MRDYGLMKSTLAVLEDVQTTLSDKLERAQDEVNEREIEFKQYSKVTNEDGSVSYQRTDEDGLISDCGRWDYEYRRDTLKSATVYRDAVEKIITYLDGYKL